MAYLSLSPAESFHSFFASGIGGIALLPIDYSRVVPSNFCPLINIIIERIYRGLSGGAKDYYAIMTEEDWLSRSHQWIIILCVREL